MDKLKVFTAFSGYDSQCLALNRLKTRFPDFDYELVGWSEIDPNAIKAHNILFPEAADKNMGDISTIDWNNVADFDLFTYSSPCQSFSLAGSLGGGEEGSGTQSSLLWECKRCIEIKRPKYLLLENVTMLVSKRFIDLFNKWIDTVNSYGYRSFWTTLNAKDFGVPQNRERVFLVSIRTDDEKAEIFRFPDKKTVQPDISQILEQDVPTTYDVDSKKVAQWVRDNQRRIVEYISERNNIKIEDVEITNPENYDIIFRRNDIKDNNMSDNKNNNLTEEQLEQIVQQEAEEQIEAAELNEFDESFSPRQETEPEDKKKAVKPIVEYLTKEEKRLRGSDRCIKRIPTPTTSDGSAPTLMATGYGSADYKNFYSVGHFPKLGVLEVWRHSEKKSRSTKKQQETENYTLI